MRLDDAEIKELSDDGKEIVEDKDQIFKDPELNNTYNHDSNAQTTISPTERHGQNSVDDQQPTLLNIDSSTMLDYDGPSKFVTSLDTIEQANKN